MNIDNLNIYLSGEIHTNWRESLIEMVNTFGVTAFFEVGPGKVLAGTVKRTIPKSNILSVGLASQIDQALEIINE